MFLSQFHCQCFHLLVHEDHFWDKIISMANKYVLYFFDLKLYRKSMRNIFFILWFVILFKGYHFFTELKTVTQLWKESDATDTKAAVSMPVMR